MQQIGFLLQNLLFPQHVSDTSMPIIRSSRIIQMVLLLSVGLPVANAPDVLQPCGLLYYP